MQTFHRQGYQPKSQRLVTPASTISIEMPPGAQAPPRSVFRAEFAFGDRVHVDDDRDLIGRVVGFCWASGDGCTTKVAWMHNGAAHEGWFQPWRLVLADG